MEDKNVIVQLFGKYPSSRSEIIRYVKSGNEINFIFTFAGLLVSPVAATIKLHDFELTKVFVENGANLNLKNIVPLLELTQWNDYTIDQTRYLVEHGADVNEINDIKFTPLFNVSYDNNLEVASYLVSKGADISARNIFGLTLIMNCLSSESFKPYFLAWLLAMGVDPFAKDRDGEDMLYLARKNKSAIHVYSYIQDFYSNKINKKQLIHNLENSSIKTMTVRDKIKLGFERVNYSFKGTFLNPINKKAIFDEKYKYESDIRVYKDALLKYENGFYFEALTSLNVIDYHQVNFDRLELIGNILTKVGLYDDARTIVSYLEIINISNGGLTQKRLDEFKNSVNIMIKY